MPKSAKSDNWKSCTKRKLNVKRTKKARTAGLGNTPKKKWKPVKSVKGRRRFAAKHGSRCYLVKHYSETGKVIWKFPICNPQGRVTCQGLSAAYSRARMTGMYPEVAKKALKRGKTMKCGWAMRHRG